MAATWRQDYGAYQRYFFNIVAIYKKRQDLRAFLEILLSLGTIIIFIAFALRPTFLTISNLLVELREKEQTVADMDTKIQNLGVAQNLLSQYQTEISTLNSAIPSSPSPEGAIRQLQGVAQSRNVSILGITTGEIIFSGPGEPKRDDSLKKLPEGSKAFGLSGSFSGSYLDLSAFITDMENLRRPFIIDSLTFNTVESEGGSSLVLSISGRVIYIQSQ